MSNGKLALASAPREEKKEEKKVYIHHKARIKKEGEDTLSRFDLVSDAAFHFFLIPFVIFVAFLAFFSGGLMAAFRKGLEILEGGKDGKKP